MGLIPINFKSECEYNPDNYKFILKKSNNTQNTIDVTTKDIEVINILTNEKENTDDFFPKNEITNDYILIIKLNWVSGDGQKIHIEGKSSKGSDKITYRFSPVSNVVFVNKKDPELLNQEFNKYISNLQSEEEKLTDAEIKKDRNTFNIEKSERFFYMDKNGDPNMFEFTIESCGIMKPYKILIESLNSLSQRLKNMNFTGFEKHFQIQTLQ